MKTTRYKRVYYSQYLVVIIAIVLVAGLALLGHWAMQRVSYEDQFVIPWAAGRSWLLEGLGPYDPQVIQLARTTLSRSEFQGQFPPIAELTEPVLNLVFSLPLSLLPYEIARTIWVTLLMVSVGLSGFLLFKISHWQTFLPEKAVVIVLLMAWLPNLQSVMMGGLAPLVVFLILYGVYAILKGKDTLAGFLLALTFGSVQISFLILILLIIWSLIKGRWSILLAYFSGLAFLWVVSLILLPGWPSGWLGMVLNNYFNLDWVQTPLLAASGLLPGISRYLMIGLHLGFAVILFVVWIMTLNSREPVAPWRFLMLLNLACLFQPMHPANQLGLALPALFLAFRYWSERWGMVGRGLSWLLTLGIFVLPWVTADFPLEFTSGLTFEGLVIWMPIVTLAALLSVRWWALTLPKIASER
jgi:ABC-type multidrug transport system fused ATPase/permease subunit